MSFSERVQGWRDNPCKFVWDNFGIDPDPWQVDALMAFAGVKPRRRVAMKACTGAGKSALLAWMGWYRMVCYVRSGEHPKGAALSGEGRDNLRDNLWAEIAKWQRRSSFLSEQFVWNKEQVYQKDHRETWFLSARSYPKDADAEAIGTSLSGLHSQFPFILLDETGRMPLTVGQKAEQIFTGGTVDGLIVQAGNPVATDGLLYDSCVRHAAQHIVITITADPDDPKRTPRVDADLAREQIERYGRDNPWVMATILGLFPPSGINTLLGVEEVESAMRRKPVDDSWKYAQKRLGVDVARFGDDRTSLCPRQGLMTWPIVNLRNARSNEIAARVAVAKSRWNHDIELIDGTGGYGSGVVDSLIQSGHSPIEVNFSGKSIDPRYFNKRAEMWFEMAEWVRRGGCLPNDPELVRELTSPTYTFQNGKFRLEEKDQIKKRLGYSPDKADALALTFALPEIAKPKPIDAHRRYLEELSGEAGKVYGGDFDPLRDA